MSTSTEELTIEHLDFEEALPCECDSHKPLFGEPVDEAAWVVEGYNKWECTGETEGVAKILMCQRCMDYWVPRKWIWQRCSNAVHLFVILSIEPIKP